MQLLFIDYTNLVIKDYEEKRKANKLSRLLMHPTTANIRQECLNVFHERMNRGKIEDDILRSFFGVPPAGRNFDYIIERHPADKFRPLRSIIKRKTKIPSLVNVEMWAWLLDFNPRPLAYAQIVLGQKNEIHNLNSNSKVGEEPNNEIKERSDLETENPDSSIADKVTRSNDDAVKSPLTEAKNDDDLVLNKSKAETNTRKTKIIVAIGLLLVVVFGGMYRLQQFGGSGQTTFGNTNTPCMYWAYDHYQQVSCNEERKGRLFLPLEKEKIKSFKMITRKDTITEWSIEKIYYIKDNNKIKYYTEPGNFPEDINRTLKRLTRHIFDKDSINRKIPD